MPESLPPYMTFGGETEAVTMSDQRNRRGKIDGFMITKSAPSRSGAGSRNAPFSSFFVSVWSPDSSSKYMSRQSRALFVNKKAVKSSGSMPIVGLLAGRLVAHY